MKAKFWVNLASAVVCAMLGVGLIVFNRTSTARAGLRTAAETTRATIILVVAILLGVAAVALGSWVVMIYFRQKNERDRAMLALMAEQEGIDPDKLDEEQAVPSEKE